MRFKAIFVKIHYSIVLKLLREKRKWLTSVSA